MLFCLAVKRKFRQMIIPPISTKVAMLFLLSECVTISDNWCYVMLCL